MQRLEVSGAVVLYIGRTVSKGVRRNLVVVRISLKAVAVFEKFKA
jgi:hypothetical protein